MSRFSVALGFRRAPRPSFRDLAGVPPEHRAEVLLARGARRRPQAT